MRERTRLDASAELLIALSNLRCSALACEYVLGEAETAALSDARDDMNAFISGSGPVRVSRGGAVHDIAGELARLCALAQRVVDETPRGRLHDEGLRVAVQRLANDLAIARSVLSAVGGDPPSRSSRPPTPARQTG